MMAVGTEAERFGAERQDPKGTPPNAPIDHWPFACNRLDSLGFRAR